MPEVAQLALSLLVIDSIFVDVIVCANLNPNAASKMSPSSAVDTESDTKTPPQKDEQLGEIIFVFIRKSIPGLTNNLLGRN